MYFLDDAPENQEEPIRPVALRQPGYLLPRIGITSMPEQPVGTNPSQQNLLGSRRWLPQDATTLRPQGAQPKPSIGHRIVAMGGEDAGPYPGRYWVQQNQQTLSGPKLGVGHRIMGVNGPPRDIMVAPWRNQLERLPFLNPRQSPHVQPLVNVDPFKSDLNHQEIFSSFVPAGAEVNGTQSFTGDQSGFNGAKATASGVGGRGNDAHLQIVPVRHIPSRIRQLKPIPEVAPNLSRVHDLPKQSKLKMSSLMRGIQEKPLPKAVRHLTQDDINEAAAVAYSENVNGSVEEYEAIISAILNRVRSGDRQFVDTGQQFTVRNVVHSKAHGDQFQGVHDDPKDPLYSQGKNYRGFAHNRSQAAENARIAAENIAAHGPTHDKKFFIVLKTGKLPSNKLVGNLGNKMQQAGPPVGGVFLYVPAPPPHKHKAPVQHQHGKGGAPHAQSSHHKR